MKIDLYKSREAEKNWRGHPRNSEELLISTIGRKEPMAYNSSERKCFYSKEFNGGCVIGMWIPNAQYCESIENVSAIDLPIENLPPRWVENNVPKELLEELQIIHDDKKCWNNHETAKLNEYGVVWSKLGIRELSRVIKGFKLKVNIKEEIIKHKKAL